MFAFITQSNHHDTSMNATSGELPRKVIISNTYNSWASRKNIYRAQNPDPIHEKNNKNDKNRKQQVEWLRNFCLPQTNQLGQTFGFAGEERVTCSRLSVRGDGRRNRHRVEKREKGIRRAKASHLSTTAIARLFLTPAPISPVSTKWEPGTARRLRKRRCRKQAGNN